MLALPVRGGTVQGALYTRRFVRNARDLRNEYLYTAPIMLLITAAIAYWLARGSLRARFTAVVQGTIELDAGNVTAVTLNEVTGVLIQGNYIGTDATGMVAVPNTPAPAISTWRSRAPP